MGNELKLKGFENIKKHLSSVKEEDSNHSSIVSK